MRVNILGALLCAALLCACAEPDRLVQSTTDDGEFRVTLEAERNWIRPGGSLPVLVRVERLAGPPAVAIDEELEFAVNGGSISPSDLDVRLAASDSLGEGGERAFSAWVEFSAATRTPPSDRAEIQAYFRDALAVLKIRITPSAQ